MAPVWIAFSCGLFLGSFLGMIGLSIFAHVRVQEAFAAKEAAEKRCEYFKLALEECTNATN